MIQSATWGVILAERQKRSSSKYWGAVQFSVIYAYTKILYLHLYITGNQSREFKTEVICCHFRLRISKRAAVLFSLCRRQALVLPGLGPRFCNNPFWYDAWYSKYYEYDTNKLWVMHLPASLSSEMWQSVLQSSYPNPMHL